MSLGRVPGSLFMFCFLASACFTGVVGCATEADPRTKGTFALYQLDGSLYPSDPTPEGAKLLHGWVILKECSIDSMAIRTELFTAFDDAIDSFSGEPVDCWNPNHAISVVVDGVQSDYLICFKCSRYEIYEGDQLVAGGYVTSAPKKTFNNVLATCKGVSGS